MNDTIRRDERHNSPTAPFGPQTDGPEDGEERVKVWHETLDHVGDTWAVEALLGRRVNAAQHLRHVDGTTAAKRRHVDGTTTAQRRHVDGTTAAQWRHVDNSSAAPRGHATRMRGISPCHMRKVVAI